MDGLRPMSGISLPSPSPRATRFSESYEISPRRPRNKIPKSLNAWVVGGTVIMMLALAGAIEVALYFSNKNQGFSMGELNTDTVQWLSGFIPTLAIGPLVWIWKQTDRDFKKLQPYVVLSRGPAKAEESVLMDLEHDNMLRTFSRALKNGYFLIIGSSLIVLFNVLLHPLAGAFFLVKPGVETRPAAISVHSTATLGLNPSYKDLTSFVSAAGYAEAAAMYNLSDPPFISGGWAIAPFEFPLDVARNSTISMNTTGLLTNVSCFAMDVVMSQDPSAPQNWTLTVSNTARGSSCNASQPINGLVAEFQYGVDIVPGCSTADIKRLADRDFVSGDPFGFPVIWFASIPRIAPRTSNTTVLNRAPGDPAGRAVLCAPTISAHWVTAVVDSETGRLVDVKETGDVDKMSNNVTGGGFAGKAFNGLAFDSQFDLSDPFVNARALAVESGIPGAIFRLASDPNRGESLDSIFGDKAGFLVPTRSIYLKYLSLLALSNYFVPTQESLDADVMLTSNRLWISPISAHILAALLALVALSGTAIHFLHSRQRTRLYLASCPGSMAHYMSVLSNTQVTSRISRDDISSPGLVGPLDDEKTMQKKLLGVRFMLEERSGTIVPISAGEPWATHHRGASWGGSQGYDTEYELEDSRKALLSPGSHVGGS